jgi:hypothetical protein
VATKKKAQIASPNESIDRAIAAKMQMLSTLDHAEWTDTIKLAIAWEKVKHSVKEDSMGDFFAEDE